MKRHAVFIILVFACLVMFCAVVVQRHELLGLRDSHQRLLARLAGASDIGRSTKALSTQAGSTVSPRGVIDVSPELLRLRNQANLLTHRRNELAGLRSENARLRLLFAEQQTKPALALRPGYIRKSQAHLVGYNTPEDTLQSFLWALQNRDATNVLLALTPEQAGWFRDQAQRSGSFEDLFENSEALVGFSLVNSQPSGDEMLQADIEVVPGLPPISVNFQKIGTEWKITSLP